MLHVCLRAFPRTREADIFAGLLSHSIYGKILDYIFHSAAAVVARHVCVSVFVLQKKGTILNVDPSSQGVCNIAKIINIGFQFAITDSTIAPLFF